MDSFKKQIPVWLKRGLKAAAFLLIFAFLLNAASVILTPKVNKREDGSSEAIHFGYRGEPKDSLDIVMVGNSDLYNAIIPIELYQYFGIAGYAGGRPYESAMGAWRQSRDILRYHRKPKVLIFETDCLFQEASQKSWDWINWKNIRESVQEHWKTLKKYSDSKLNDALGTKLGSLLPAVKYHSNWKKLTLQDFMDPFHRAYHYAGKGYILNIKCKPYKGGFDYMEPGRTPEAALSRQAKAALKKVMDACQKRGIQLLLADMPSSKSWSYEKHRAVASFAQENGVAFLDMNIEAQEGRFPFDWMTDTKDAGSHLNLSGAQKATAYLGEYLKAHYDLPDRRQDPQYDSWKDDMIRFQELRAQKAVQEAKEEKARKVKAVQGPAASGSGFKKLPSN